MFPRCVSGWHQRKWLQIFFPAQFIFALSKSRSSDTLVCSPGDRLLRPRLPNRDKLYILLLKGELSAQLLLSLNDWLSITSTTEMQQCKVNCLFSILMLNLEMSRLPAASERRITALIEVCCARPEKCQQHVQNHRLTFQEREIASPNTCCGPERDELISKRLAVSVWSVCSWITFFPP